MVETPLGGGVIGIRSTVCAPQDHAGSVRLLKAVRQVFEEGGILLPHGLPFMKLMQS